MGSWRARWLKTLQDGGQSQALHLPSVSNTLYSKGRFCSLICLLLPSLAPLHFLFWCLLYIFSPSNLWPLLDFILGETSQNPEIETYASNCDFQASWWLYKWYWRLYLLLCLCDTYFCILKCCLWITFVFSSEVINAPWNHTRSVSWLNVDMNSVERDTVSSYRLLKSHKKYRWGGAINTSLVHWVGREVLKIAVL